MNNPGGETAVSRSRSEFALVWIGFPILGALLGLAVRPLARLGLDQDWMPVPGPLRLIAELPQPQATIGTVAAGVVLGVVVALTAEGEVLRVALSSGQVTLTRDGKTRTVDRSAVAGGFVDGKSLVLVGRSGEELAREKSDLPAGKLAAAFTAHGYAWFADGDPYRDAYHRWVPETPDLPDGANAVLKARQLALDKGDRSDLEDLRTELAKLGVVVRDEQKRQYWRHARIGG